MCGYRTVILTHTNTYGYCAFFFTINPLMTIAQHRNKINLDCMGVPTK